MKKIEFTEAQKNEIINLYSNNFWSLERLFKKFETSQGVIRKILEEKNIPLHTFQDYRKIKKWSCKLDLDKEEIVRLYTEDLLNAKEIGKIMDCSEIPIYRILKEENINTSIKNRKQLLFKYKKIIPLKGKDNHFFGKKPHNFINFNENQIKEIIELYKEKFLNMEEIGKKFNCSTSVIKRILNKNKIYIKPNIRFKELYKVGKLVPWNKGKPFLAGEKNPMYGKLREKHPHFVKLDEEKIIELYNKGLSSKEIGEIYNVSGQCILERLRNLSIERRKVIYGQKDLLTSDDGHKVRSSPELYIDNWLFHNRIIHIYDKKLGFGNFKCDFYIPDANLYIEYWGLHDIRINNVIRYYIEKTQKKLEMYRKLGLNLLSIFPKDNISQKLNPLLEFSKNQTTLNEFRVIE